MDGFDEVLSSHQLIQLVESLEKSFEEAEFRGLEGYTLRGGLGRAIEAAIMVYVLGISTLFLFGGTRTVGDLFRYLCVRAGQDVGRQAREKHESLRGALTTVWNLDMAWDAAAGEELERLACRSILATSAYCIGAAVSVGSALEPNPPGNSFNRLPEVVFQISQRKPL